MERNDLWFNVKGTYIFFVGKILLNLHWNIEIQNNTIPLIFSLFDASQAIGYTRRYR